MRVGGHGIPFPTDFAFEIAPDRLETRDPEAKGRPGGPTDRSADPGGVDLARCHRRRQSCGWWHVPPPRHGFEGSAGPECVGHRRYSANSSTYARRAQHACADVSADPHCRAVRGRRDRLAARARPGRPRRGGAERSSLDVDVGRQIDCRTRLRNAHRGFFATPGDLHPVLDASARPNFERGDYATAVFAAS